MQIGSLRQAVRQFHLWLGLALGGLFALLGLTGSILAFYPELDALLHPEFRVEGRGPENYSPDWDRSLATLRKAFPDKHGPWRFEVTDHPGPIPVRYYNPPERAGHDFRPMLVWLSADGTQVLRRDYWGETTATFLYDLHYRLLLGQTGGTVLGWTGFGLLALLLSGLWAWWPRGSLAKALRFKPRAAPLRRLRDWHKLSGLAGLIVLLVLTMTGIMLELPEESDTALNTMGLPVETMPHVHSVGEFQNARISLSDAVQSGLAGVPRGRLAWIESPSESGGIYKLRMQVPGDPSFRFPHSFVWIDAGSGKVLALHDARHVSAGNTVNNWVHPLHDGSAFGLFGRLLVAICGIVPAALFLTGWLRWRRRVQSP